MPTPAAEAREDEVLRLVVAHLERGGNRIEIRERPDRSPGQRDDGLTVDAVLRINDEDWALDIVSLRWRPTLESAVDKIESVMKRKFGARFEAAGMSLQLNCHPSTDDNAISALVRLAEHAVSTGEDSRAGDQAALVRPRTAGLATIEILPWLSATADIAQEVSDSLGVAVAKKLKGQLPRARKLGYRIALVIDQRGPQDLRYGGNFLPSDGTIAGVVREIEQSARCPLDNLYLVDTDDGVRALDN